MQKTKVLLLLSFILIVSGCGKQTDTSNNVLSKQESNISNILDSNETIIDAGKEEDVFRVDSTNAYFPEYTVKEIKAWYVKNVNDFIATGKTDKTLKYFQEHVAEWADWVTDMPEAALNISYRVDVNKYNKEETQDFYLVQKRIYDFIKDYTKETGLYLNFNEWEAETTYKE